MNVQFFWGCVMFASILAVPLTFEYAPPLAAWLTLPVYAALSVLGVIGWIFGDPRDINKPRS